MEHVSADGVLRLLMTQGCCVFQSFLSAGVSTLRVFAGGNNNLAAELNLNLILFRAAPAANLKAILSSVDEITEQKWQICPTHVRGG